MAREDKVCNLLFPLLQQIKKRVEESKMCLLPSKLNRVFPTILAKGEVGDGAHIVGYAMEIVNQFDLLVET